MQARGQQSGYTVSYYVADSAEQKDLPALKNQFSFRMEAMDYVNGLAKELQTKGYVTASIDSVRFDSLQGEVQLYLGRKYQWARLSYSQTDSDLLQSLRWPENAFTAAPFSFADWQKKQAMLLNYLEENGHPFARVFLDSIELEEAAIEAVLKIQRGPLYKIDSIRIYGDAKVNNEFLQRYLDIPAGSYYNKKKILAITKKLATLPYVIEEKPATVSYLATGSVLNLYLKNKKVSQVNLLAGFLPDPNALSGKKFNFTIDANLLLRNALGNGESIGLNWQKLQPQSQRLNLLFEQPYVFQSPFGIGFRFDMLRKDSTYLNIDMRLGAQYGAGQTQSASVFFQRQQTIVNSINAAQVLATKKLPAEGDVHSNNLGLTYRFNTTDYLVNPRKGNEFDLVTSAGLKRVKRNNQVLELKDPNNPAFNFSALYDTVKTRTYQIRVAGSGAHFFPVGKQATIKTGVQAGWYSSGVTFRNELFQIGGYRILRGFDEESQFVTQYAIGTVEYRFILQRNSNFFVFTDGGWGRHLGKIDHTYLSAGSGISFETKAGIFNLVLAIGSRDDMKFNLRQSKVHFGFINYF